jgi:lipoate-protein ligase A
MKLTSLYFFDDAEPRSAAQNMALDEALFLHTTLPVIRSYRWVRPAVSFGYFLPWGSVFDRFPDRDLVRRWTGGGIVEHGNDFTYSIVLRDRIASSSEELYRLVHSTLARLLRNCGYPVEISETTAQGASDSCFEKPVRFDLKIGREKIAGAAIRRNRSGVLLQGSIQRLEVPSYFAETFAGALSEHAEELTLPETIMESTERITNEKYGAAEWTRRF